MFLFILLRFSKKLSSEIRDNTANKSDNKFIKSTFPNPKIKGEELDEFIMQYYEEVKNLKHYGTTRRAISQQTNIPRTSVKRILDRLMKRKLVTVTKNDNLNVIGINYKDTKKNAKNFLNELGNPYDEIIFDDKGC